MENENVKNCPNRSSETKQEYFFEESPLEPETRYELKCNCVSEYEMIRGRNGIALYNEWHKPEESEGSSWREVARANRVMGDIE
jgi:hypothetical protein